MPVRADLEALKSACEVAAPKRCQWQRPGGTTSRTSRSRRRLQSFGLGTAHQLLDQLVTHHPHRLRSNHLRTLHIKRVAAGHQRIPDDQELHRSSGSGP